LLEKRGFPQKLKMFSTIRGMIKENILNSLELKSLDNFPCNNILLYLDGCKYPEIVNYTDEGNNFAILLLSILKNSHVYLLIFHIIQARLIELFKIAFIILGSSAKVIFAST
jgi:hypothetical protein